MRPLRDERGGVGRVRGNGHAEILVTLDSTGRVTGIELPEAVRSRSSTELSSLIDAAIRQVRGHGRAE